MIGENHCWGSGIATDLKFRENEINSHTMSIRMICSNIGNLDFRTIKQYLSKPIPIIHSNIGNCCLIVGAGARWGRFWPARCEDSDKEHLYPIFWNRASNSRRWSRNHGLGPQVYTTTTMVLWGWSCSIRILVWKNWISLCITSSIQVTSTTTFLVLQRLLFGVAIYWKLFAITIFLLSCNSHIWD